MLWQRQFLYLLTFILTFFYFDHTQIQLCYGLILVSELIDIIIARRVSGWKTPNANTANRFLVLILANTILSAGAIGFWIILLAKQQGAGGHFMHLFFLFSASLFAAMNNHQLLPVLALRLVIYSAIFQFIPLRDIWIVRPEIGSELSLNFFTVLFVMYFIIDGSSSFLRQYRKYRKGLQQLEDLSIEYENAKAASKAKSEFLAVVSHELRTPLTAIKGTLDLVNHGAFGHAPKEMTDALELVAKNSDQLTFLITDFLDLQKLEADQMTFHFERLNVRELVLNAVESSKYLKNMVFECFSQADSSAKRKFGGTGLGMNIAKQIVENHNGTIGYKSKLGSGSIFACEFETI